MSKSPERLPYAYGAMLDASEDDPRVLEGLLTTGRGRAVLLEIARRAMPETKKSDESEANSQEE